MCRRALTFVRFVALAWLLLAAASAHAVVLTWQTGVSSNWTGAASWLDPTPAATNWIDLSDAVFSGTSGEVVNVTGDAKVRNITFSTTDYIIDYYGGTLTLEGSLTTDVPEISVAATMKAELRANLAGVAGLKKIGDGVLMLSGSNTGLTGGIAVNAGTLQATRDEALNGNTVSVAAGATFESFTGWSTTLNSDINLNGGTLRQGGANQLQLATGSPGKKITVGADSIVDIVSAGTITLGAAQLAGSSKLTKIGDGTLQLTGDNTFTGAWQIDAGVLDLQASGGLGSGAVTLNAGELALWGGAAVLPTNALTINGGILSGSSTDLVAYAHGFNGTLTAAGNFTIAARDYTTKTLGRQVAVNGAISGSGNITIEGPSTPTAASGLVMFTGTNTLYSGTLTIKDGATLRITNGNATGSGNIVLTNMLDFGASKGSTLELREMTNAGGFTLSNKTITISDTSSGGSAANSRRSIVSTFDTLVTPGTNTLGTITAGVSDVTINLTGDRGMQFYSDVGNFVVNAKIDGTSAVGTNTSISFRGPSTGTVGAGGINLPYGSISLTDNATWTLLPAANATSHVWTDTQLSTGKLTLGGATIGSSNLMPATTKLNFGQSGGTPTLDLAGWNQAVAKLSSTAGSGAISLTNSTVGAPVTFTVNQDEDSTFAGVISGELSMVKNGIGNLVLSAASTYTGTTTVNAGSLGFGSGTAFGTSTTNIPVGTATNGAGLVGYSTTNNATLTLNRNIDILAGTGISGLAAQSGVKGAVVTANYAGTVTLGRDLAVNANAFATVNLSGTVNGAGKTLTKTGAGTVRLGPNVTPFAAINYSGGTVQFAPGTGNTVTPGGTVLNNGNIQAADGTLDFGSAIITTTNRYTAGLREIRQDGANGIVNVANQGGEFNLTTSAGNVPNASVSNVTNGWINNSTYVYTGQIYVADVASSGQGSISFGESFDDSVRVTIDGVQRLYNTSASTTSKSGTITLAAGWHTFEVRFGQGTGAVGRVADATNSWGTGYNNLGFGYNAAGLDSLYGGDYVAPTDSGTMDLFRSPTSMLIADAGATIKAGGFTNNGVLVLNGTAATAGAIELTKANSTSDTLTIQVACQARTDTNPLASITLAAGHTLNTANLQMTAGSVLTVAGSGTLNIGQSDDAAAPFANWVAATSTLKADGGTVNFLKPAGAELAGLLLDMGPGAVNINESINLAGLVNHGTPGALTLASGKTLTLTPTASRTFTGALVGNGGVVLNGTSTQIFAATSSTFAGSYSVNSGTLQANTTGALNTLPITLNGGTLALANDGDGSSARQIIVYGDNLTVTANAAVTVARIGGTGLNKTIQLGGLSIGASTLTVTPSNGYGLEFTGALTLTGTPTFSVGTATGSNVVQGLTISGPISGAGFGITKAGAGTLALGNSGSTFGGSGAIIDITAGIVAAGSDGALGDSANQIYLNINAATAAGFRATDTFATNRVITLNQASNAIEVVQDKTLTLNTALGLGATANKLQKNDSGILVLNADNPTWDGVLTVASGAVRITKAGVLGTATGNTIVNGNSGRAVQIAGGITVAEPLQIDTSSDNGATSGLNWGGALESVAGVNVWSGPITINGAVPGADNTSRKVVIGAALGSDLTISGGITFSTTATGTNRPVYQVLTGAGTGTLSSAVANSGTGLTGLQKYGTGTWTITAAQAYNHHTYVMEGGLVFAGAGKITNATVEARQGTTLTLDDSGTTPLNNRLNGRPLNLYGSTFNYIVNSTAASSETIGVLTTGGGAQITINVSNPGSQNSALTFASVSRGTGDGINYTGALGTATNKILFTTSPAVTNGTVGRATVNGVDFAGYDATVGIKPFTAYAAITDINAAVATDVVRVNSGYTVTNLTAAKSIHALAIDGTGLNVGGTGTLTVTGTSGMLINGGSNTISVPTLAMGTEAYLYINSGATLNLNSTLTGTSGFDRYGSGTLVINTPSKLTGLHVFGAGTTQLAAGDNTLAAGQDVIVGKAATLDLMGSLLVARNFYGGYVSAGQSGAGGTLTGSAGSMLVTKYDTSNDYTFPGSITGSASFVKTGGSGKTLTLNYGNTHSGVTILMGGTTTLVDYGTLANTSSLELDYTALNLDNTGLANINGTATSTGRLNKDAAVNLRTGAITLKGRAQTATTEYIKTLNLLEGTSEIAITPGGTNVNSADLVIGTITQANNATLNVHAYGQIGSNGRILLGNGTALLKNNILPVWIESGGTNWVSYNADLGIGDMGGNGFPAFDGTVFPAASSAAETQNISLAAAGQVPAGGLTINTLRTAGAVTFANAGDVLNLTAGGIMRASGNFSIGGTPGEGKITSGGSAPTTGANVNALYVHVGGSTSDIKLNSNFVDNPSVTDARVRLVAVLYNGATPGITFAGTANTYSGGTVLDGWQGGGGKFTVASGANLPGGGLTINGNVTFVQATGGIIDANNDVTLNGPGTATFDGANTVRSLTINNTGGTTAPSVTTGGTLSLSANNSITATSANVYTTSIINGVLNLTATSPTISVDKVLVNSKEVSPGQAALTIAAQIQGTNGFTKSGAGVLALSNTGNAWSSTTTVSTGVLRQTAAGALSPNGAYVVNTGATLDLNGLAASLASLSGAGTVSNPGAAAVLTVGGGTFDGLITATTPANLSLVKNTSGTLTLTNPANNFAGGVTVNTGTLALAGAGINTTGTGLVTVNSGATLSGSGLISGGLTLNYGSSVSIPLSATTPIISTGAGALTLNAISTPLSVTGTPSAGVYALMQYGNASALTSAQFATLNLASTPGGSYLYGLINNQTSKTVDLSVETVQASQAWTGTINGVWDVGVTTNWSGNTTYVSPHQVVFGDGPTNTTITGAAVTPQAIAVSSNTANYSIANNIGGTLAGGLSKSGDSTLTLTGANTFTGPINVTGGTLRAAVSSAATALGSGNISLADGTTLQLDGTAATTSGGLTARRFNTAGLTTGINFGATAGDMQTFTGAYTARNQTGGDALQVTGKINLASGGIYNFYTSSDDASRLFIDGRLVVNNDGDHSANEVGGTVRLEPGLHDIRIDYENKASGNGSLTLLYQAPGGVKGTVPASVLIPSENAALTGASNTLALGNNVSIAGTTAINLTGTALGAQLGVLTAASNSTLNVTGGATQQVRFNRTSLGGGTFTLNAAPDLALGQLVDNGAAVTIVKKGAGRLILDNAATGDSASSLVAGSLIDVQSGKLVLQGASGGGDPIGAAAVQLTGGGLLLDTKAGGPTFNNAVSLLVDTTIEVLPDGQTTTLGGATNGVTIATNRTLTIDVYGGARNTTNPNGAQVVAGAALAVAGPITGTGANVVLKSSQFNGEEYPIYGSATFQAANNYTGATTLSGSYINNATPMTLTLNANGSILGTTAINVNQAGLTLDNSSTVVADRLRDTAPVNLNQGVLTFKGNTTSVVNETVGALNLTGHNQIVTSGLYVSGANGLTAQSLARNNRATLAVSGDNLGSASTNADLVKVVTPIATSDFIGGGGTTATNVSILPYVVAKDNTTSGQTHWSLATYDATNGFRPLRTTEYATLLAAAATDNARDVQATQVTAGITLIGKTVNAYIFDYTNNHSSGTTPAADQPQTVTISGTLALTSGVFMTATTGTTYANQLTFTGGAIDFGTAGGQIFNYDNHATGLTIASTLQDNGTAGLTVAGLRPILLTNTANTFHGLVTVNGVMLQIAGDGSLGNTDNDIALAGGTLRFAAATTLPATRDVTIVANTAATFDTGGGSSTISGNVTGSGTLVKIGSNTLTLSNPNYTAATLVYGGTLVTKAATVVGNPYVDFGTTLQFTDDGTFAGQITGGGNFVKSGAGTFTFTNLQAYGGDTKVLAGTLVVPAGDEVLPGTGRLLLGTVNSAAVTLANPGTPSPVTFSGGQTMTAFSYTGTGSGTLDIPAGKTWTVSGSNDGSSASNSSSSANVFRVGGNTTGGVATNLTFTGGGSLVVNNSAAPFALDNTAANGGSTATVNLDLSALANFNATVSSLRVGYGNYSTSSLNLAAANTITATSLSVGNANNNGQGATGTSLVSLGQSNTINVGSITAGTYKCSGKIEFRAGLTDPTLTLRGATGGTSRVTTITLGQFQCDNSGSTPTGTMDLTRGSVDALIDTLVVAQHEERGSATDRGAFGDFSFSAGSVDVNTLIVGRILDPNTTTPEVINGRASGTFTMGGGTLVVNTKFAIGERNTNNLTAKSIGVATFNGGTATIGCDITSNANGDSTLTLNGATLNLSGKNIGTAADPIDTLNFQAGTLKNVASINGTAGLTKTTSGVLTLEGTNTYSGATAVNVGTLVVNGSVLGAPTSGNVTVAAGATLSGTGTLGGALTTLNGTLAPGDRTLLTAAAGTLTVNNTINLTGGMTDLRLFGVGANDRDKLVSTAGDFTFGGMLNVTKEEVAPWTFAAGQSWDLFDWNPTGAVSGTFTNVFPAGLPVLPSELTWDTSALYTTGVISIAGVGPITGTWTGATSSLWSTSVTGNWTGSVPSAAAHVAIFPGSGANTSIKLDVSKTVGQVAFTGGSYTLGAAVGPTEPTLTLDNTGVVPTAAATITATAGSHTINAKVLTAGTDLDVTTSTTGALNLAGGLTNVATKTVTLSQKVAGPLTANALAISSIANEGALLVKQSGSDAPGYEAIRVTTGIDGTGDTTVGTTGGVTTATLITEHIRQDVLTINAGSKVKISATGGAASTSVVNVLNIANASGSFNWSSFGGDISPAATGGPVASGAAVPEPATWLLAVIAALAGLVAWRRRK